MLTRPHRQVAATIALALFTIAPTLWVSRTVHALGRPGHARDVEAEIGRRLGLLVHIGNATHPRPDVDVLRDVSLRMDDAGHGEIARAASVRLVRSSGEMTLKVEHLALNADDASDALGRIVILMRRMATSGDARVSLVADRCDVTMNGRVEALRDLAAIVQLDRSSPSLSASYLIADDDSRDRTRCELSVTCEAPGTTRVSRPHDGRSRAGPGPGPLLRRGRMVRPLGPTRRVAGDRGAWTAKPGRRSSAARSRA